MEDKELLRNVPNTITFLRVVLTAVIVLLYLMNYSVLVLLVVFIIAAFTDFLDGVFARKLNQETLFGARFDILADRLLWVTFGLILIFGYRSEPFFDLNSFFMIFTREIFSAIFLIFYLIFSRKVKVIPYVRYGGKLLTVLQAIAIPSMILNAYYSQFGFYIYLVWSCGIIGIISFIYYAIDITLYPRLKKTRFVKIYDSLNPIAPAPYRDKLTKSTSRK